MALTNYKTKIAIVYTSITGNTECLANRIYENAAAIPDHEASLFTPKHFPFERLTDFDAVLVGTYTWGNGRIPREMRELYEAMETIKRKQLVTGVFGTGDRFFANYCGAVNQFRDMLYVRTNLAATLKVELMPQVQDESRSKAFVDAIARRIEISCRKKDKMY